MCMGRNLGQAALKRYQAKGKNGYIRVWKTVQRAKRWFRSDCRGKTYKGGFYHATYATWVNSDNCLIHAFRDKKSARTWTRSYEEVVECMVVPAWIMAIGSDHNKRLTLTTKAIVMPEFPKTKVTVREFRAAVEGKKVKTYKWES